MEKTKKNVEYYMKLPYTYIIEWSDIDDCFLGSIVELERNMTCGNTREEVLINLKEALSSYIATSLENEMEIPEPLNMEDFKGNISYRTSKERHYLLAKQAKLHGKSINAFIDEAIGEKLLMH
ncbi:MAG: type II toxin-antitoxin system HicB family antitoxin [Treponema sp.]|jgi:predicted RNase H-like HicB family nuclease|nr:type II toxin-antitoxin system HicB family antitoxin [Treponema sp.]